MLAAFDSHFLDAGTFRYLPSAGYLAAINVPHPSVSTAISAISVLSACIGHAIYSVSDGVFLVPKLIDKDTRLAEQSYRELDGRLPKSCVSELLAVPAKSLGSALAPAVGRLAALFRKYRYHYKRWYHVLAPFFSPWDIPCADVCC